MRKIFMPLVASLAFSMVSSPLSAATLGQNLILNGNAEQGNGDPIGNAVGADIPAISGWNSTNNFSVLQYGATGFEFVNPRGETVRVSGLPDVNSPGPADRGLNLFYGGANRGSSSASQSIDLTDLATIIDAGRGFFELSGWMGGLGSDPDNAVLSITFLNSNGLSVGDASIATPTPSQRNNTTGLFFQSVDGLVPVGTRQVNVLLNMNYVRGRVNDGYADNLSLTITAVPEPSAILATLMVGSLLIITRPNRAARSSKSNGLQD